VKNVDPRCLIVGTFCSVRGFETSYLAPTTARVGCRLSHALALGRLTGKVLTLMGIVDRQLGLKRVQPRENLGR
jgi:hypothetical protein